MSCKVMSRTQKKHLRRNWRTVTVQRFNLKLEVPRRDQPRVPKPKGKALEKTAQLEAMLAEETALTTRMKRKLVRRLKAKRKTTRGSRSTSPTMTSG